MKNKSLWWYKKIHGWWKFCIRKNHWTFPIGRFAPVLFARNCGILSIISGKEHRFRRWTLFIMTLNQTGEKKRKERIRFGHSADCSLIGVKSGKNAFQKQHSTLCMLRRYNFQISGNRNYVRSNIKSRQSRNNSNFSRNSWRNLFHCQANTIFVSNWRNECWTIVNVSVKRIGKGRGKGWRSMLSVIM